MSKVENLGCKNGWSSEQWQVNQPRIQACVESGMKITKETPYNCYTVYTCEEAGICWSVDSGD